ncbi:MAG: alpha/beta hydrolase [Pseudomonadales bacterium]|nr:alpha/beta hydrolase [Pseudomonadales bacterium]
MSLPIDKNLLAFIESFNGMQMHISATTLPKYRKMLKKNAAQENIPNVEVSLQSFIREETEVKIKIYKPRTGAALKPALLWMHGGGYIMGSVNNDPIAVEIAKAMDVIIVSVDYSLAPEKPFPAAHNDCYLALQWLYEQADSLGINRDKIAIGGDSAGAGLAACLVQRLVAEKGPEICFQLLLYPMLDHQHNTPSGLINDYPVWNRQTSLNAWQMFLADVLKCELPRYAAAATAEDLTGLPPTFITVGQVDLFRDECMHYAQRLMQKGVPTGLNVVPGMVHGGQFLVPDAAVSQDMKSAYLKALKDALIS